SMPGQHSSATHLAHDKSHLHIYLLQGALLAIVLAIDFATRLGLAEWVLYLIPVGLCLLQPRPMLSFGVAAAATALVAVGYFASPPGADPTLAGINRSLGVSELWMSAFLIRQVVQTRGQVHKMVWLQQGQTSVAQSVLGEQTVA